jgi:hypothetical protein
MISLKTTLASTMLASLVTLADGGTGAAYITIYSGTVPTTAETVLSGQTALAQLTCSKPSATVSGKTLTFAAITSHSISASGTASFFRLCASDGTVVLQGSVSDTIGSGDLKLGTTALVSGGTAAITSATVALP